MTINIIWVHNCVGGDLLWSLIHTFRSTGKTKVKLELAGRDALDSLEVRHLYLKLMISFRPIQDSGNLLETQYTLPPLMDQLFESLQIAFELYICDGLLYSLEAPYHAHVILLPFILKFCMRVCFVNKI